MLPKLTWLGQRGWEPSSQAQSRQDLPNAEVCGNLGEEASETSSLAKRLEGSSLSRTSHGSEPGNFQP
jgi:hypothetical protein